MRNFIKKITHPFLRAGLKLYYSKPRKYRYGDSFAWVHPEVFPPRLTLSTRLLLDFISGFDLHDKIFLELGCGSGIISIQATKKGAITTSTDINETALDFLRKSASENKVPITVLYSDLFENLQGRSFDYILINPPYYPKNPKSVREMAWFCGEGFEYFGRLFAQLPGFIKGNQVFMILSEDCDLNTIQAIASKNRICFETVLEKTVFAEKNYIFRLVLNI